MEPRIWIFVHAGNSIWTMSVKECNLAGVYQGKTVGTKFLCEVQLVSGKNKLGEPVTAMAPRPFVTKMFGIHGGDDEMEIEFNFGNVTSFHRLADDCPLVKDAKRAWIPEAVTPATVAELNAAQTSASNIKQLADRFREGAKNHLRPTFR